MDSLPVQRVPTRGRLGDPAATETFFARPRAPTGAQGSLAHVAMGLRLRGEPPCPCPAASCVCCVWSGRGHSSQACALCVPLSPVLLRGAGWLDPERSPTLAGSVRGAATSLGRSSCCVPFHFSPPASEPQFPGPQAPPHPAPPSREPGALPSPSAFLRAEVTPSTGAIPGRPSQHLLICLRVCGGTAGERQGFGSGKRGAELVGAEKTM